MRKYMLLGLILSLFFVFNTSLLADSPGWVERSTVNGLNIFLQKTDSQIIELTLLLKSGSGLDPYDKKGTAMIMNSLVMLQLKYGKAKLGKVAVETYPDYSLIKIKTTNKKLKASLNQIRELLSYPLYNYDVITDLKKIYATDLKGISVLAKAYYALNREIYGQNHPYNDELQPESLTKITGVDVYKWYRRTYQPGNAILSISGDVKYSWKRIKRVFQNLMSEPVNNNLYIKPIYPQEQARFEYEDPNGRMASICIGLAAPRIQDEEYAAFRLLTYYLNDYMHYFEELRVKEGLFYAGYVFYNYREKPQSPCLFFMTATAPAYLERVEQRTLEVINQLVNSGIPQKEIKRVLSAMKITAQRESLAGKGLATKNALNYYLRTALVYDQNIWPKLEKITTEDIKKAAGKYLQQHTSVIYLPKELAPGF